MAEPDHLRALDVGVLVAEREVRDRPPGLVGDAEQQRDDHPVRDERGPAVGEEGSRQTGQRDQPGDAADDDEDLDREDAGETGGHELAEAVPADQGRAQRALDDEAVEQDDRDDGGQAELLADGGDDEVGVGVGDAVRAAVAEAAADEATPAHAEHRLDGLEAQVAALVVVVERLEPDVHADRDVAEELVGQEGPGEEEPTADDQPARPLGGDVQHDQEQAEEQQAGAEVALEDQDAEADQPHRQDRAEVAAAGQVDEEDAATGQRERVAVQHQVAGERDDEEDLRDLARLEAERAEVDPDPGTVDGAADDREHRQQQQQDRGEAAGVGEALQHAVVAQQHQRRHEEQHAERHPDQLLLGEAVRLVGGLVGEVEPVDDREAEPVEGRDHRQQHRVGVRRDERAPRRGSRRPGSPASRRTR